MFRLILAVVGIVLLIAAGVIGLRIVLPVPTQTATIGGAEVSMQVLAMQTSGGPESAPAVLPAELDGVTIANTEALALDPQIAIGAESIEAAPALLAAEPPVLAVPADAVIVPLATSASAQEVVSVPPPALEQRFIELTWPSEFRLGGSGVIRLTFEPMPEGGYTPVAEVDGQQVAATPILLTNRYTTHDAHVMATVAAPTFNVAAATPEEQVMQPGQALSWVWTLSPESAGEQVIALSVTVNWQPKGGGITDSITVWNDVLNVQVGQVFGLTIPQAGLAGTAAAVIGVVLEIPFLDSILGFIWRRRPRRRRRERR